MGDMTAVQRQLLAILVRDFGYTRQPVYGHTPLRHQVGWMRATEGLDPADVALEVDAIAQAAERDGEELPDPYAVKSAS